MATTQQASLYAVGSASPQRKDTATLETKPSSINRDGKRDSGGGYERWRSYEWRPHTARQGKEDVYVPVHRLCAVAWCYPDDWSVSDILADLDGNDVHHTSGVEWDNRESVLEVLDHGTHSSLTNAERRAFAEEDKRRATQPVEPATPTCDHCDSDADTLCRSPDWDGVACVACSKRLNDGAEIEVT